MNPTGTKPAISVIIVNFNAGDALVRCVKSVLEQQVPVHITVVDNASTDNSLAILRQFADGFENISIQASGDNLGFARAINFAAAGLSGEGQKLLILNPDCEMLPGALSALEAGLDADPQAVLAGPLVVDREGQPMRATLRRFPDPWKALLTFSGLWRLGRWIPAFAGVEIAEEIPAGTVQAEAVSGACMLIRQPEFLEIGCMDGSYGLHCEDLDLMYRLRQQGFHCLFVPSARVFHEQGVSSSSRPLWVHWQKHLGMQRFFVKFQAAGYAFPIRWLVILGIWLRFVLTLPLAWFKG